MSSGEAATSVSELIFRQVEQRPDQPALLHAEQEISYQQLWNMALGWAHATLPRLSEPETVIGVLRPRGIEVPVCHLAVWLAGAAYLPIDPAFPPGRIKALLTEAGCEVVLTTPALTELLPTNITAITAPADATDPLEAKANAAQLAYVMGTSGTTGAPKCVEVEHGSLALLVDWYRNFFKLGPGVRASLLACLDRDGLIMDEWGTLASGGTLVIPDEKTLESPELIGAFMSEYQVEHAYIPAPLMEDFLVSGQRPTKLRSIYTGSDRLRVWPATDYPAAVHNGYGPTEATVTATTTRDLRLEGTRTKLPSIGKAIAGVQLWLETSEGAVITEPGTAGEVMIGGPFVARGYRNQPDITASVFLQKPDGTRYYRTGDICVWDEAGELEFLGRRDRQVKARGLRTELAEVEQAIMSVPGVRNVVVTAQDDETRRHLEALIDAPAVTETTIRARLKDVLPKAMVPESIGFVDASVQPDGPSEAPALSA